MKERALTFACTIWSKVRHYNFCEIMSRIETYAAHVHSTARLEDLLDILLRFKKKIDCTYATRRDTWPKSICVSRTENRIRGLRAYVFVIDQLHELEFSVGPLRMCHILKRSRQLLDCHILRSDGIVRRAATEMEEELKIIRSYTLDCAISS